ncbi:LOW QUALITY PROTEIN: hypothetical protein PRUPE_1G072900 [Prunus persica]|uniref:Protein kinase domain-containing protein n=1 Tax=Prunus persica TaxID=3760 RepID=A0A251QTN2_PRUPE|nr:LOW QUALITY PROTEIN: hypothetical protein PRUPE_1G072900 [Prunus persica]
MLGNLTSVINLCMEQNMFSESIPLSLANCQKLQLLNLPSNNLTGTRPKKLFTLSSLTISLSMSNNFLTGSLPSEVGDLVNLAELDVSGNKLSGEIPATLDSCTILERLHLNNEFEGTIPESPYSFKRLGRDVSRNNLSGKIPDFLGKFRALNHLNLSYNDFEGELPKEGIVSNASGLSVLGNHRLCGGIPQLLLPACLRKKPHSSQGILAPKECFIATCLMVKKLNIAIDVDSALDYLHNHCETSIVHCDLKPSNVLLDEDIVAHVGDFGLARFLLEASNTQSQSQTMSARLRGSIGYIPPVALSLLVEKVNANAADDRCGDNIRARPSTSYQDGYPVQARRLEECLVSVMQLGLSCSAISPTERMLMNVVVNQMKAIRDSYHNLRRQS